VAVGIARGVGGAAARQTKTQYQWPLTHPSWVNNKGRWYDCLYLALAETSGCDFVTADPRLCARVRAHDLRVRTFSLFDILDDVGIRKDP
jgi:hypothetical protein